MKTISLLCAISWALSSLFSLYDITLGYSPIIALFIESPMESMQAVIWVLSDIAMTAFFFVLWTKQD